MGDFVKSADSFELSIALKDDFASSWFNLGVAYANMNKINDSLSSI